MSEEQDGLTPGEKIEQAVGDAIAEAISTNDCGYTIKWISVVEVLDEQGERGVWTFTSDGVKRWDVFGLLEELRHYQTARSVAEILREED